ncbi:hypothetical protein P691DRAFT_188771 [Macrolepiota fuliginosa MF-IS2]|uniref:Uncharacterized protein n=1 Tax=Macrolepiota fuliginosa MF-IS2 TaxID=1400762 RepID=A0A9P5X8D1_9AGAR|nr:hypothetical protein P691DRAFT_188771 [Macrolepiota fuliginosa MF-IS2]
MPPTTTTSTLAQDVLKDFDVKNRTVVGCPEELDLSQYQLPRDPEKSAVADEKDTDIEHVPVHDDPRQWSSLRKQCYSLFLLLL